MSKPLMYSGFHSVWGILRHRPEAVLALFVQESRAGRSDPRLEALCAEAERFGIRPQYARREILERHAGPQHQGVVARARPRLVRDQNQLLTKLEQFTHDPLLLLLDGVTDPHNLGACLRTADAVGVDAVVVPRRHACGLTPTACRSAAGAAESVPYFEVSNLGRVMDELKQQGVQILGTARDDTSRSLLQINVDGPLAVVMGAEGQGMRRLTREKCDQLLEIPMVGEVESLNVSVATAVVLYQLARPKLSGSV